MSFRGNVPVTIALAFIVTGFGVTLRCSATEETKYSGDLWR
jgi:hypothetical protein